MIDRKGGLLAATALALCPFTGGMAQTSATSAPRVAAETSPARGTATEDGEVGEVVVTANRESSLLSKTPLAITAITGEGLIKGGVTNATQLGESVPSVSIDRNNGLQITIRGVSSTDQTEKGDASAGFAVDGVFISRPQAQEVSFFDIQRVEVLRGPQGTLYGRNTTAGLVSLITNRPRLGEFSGSVDATYGNFDTTQATGVLNVPVGDSVAMRAAVNFDRRDSFVEDAPGSAFTGNPAKDNLSGRLSLLVQPSNALTVVLRGDYSAIKGRFGTSPLLSTWYQRPFTVPVDGQFGIDPIKLNVDDETLRTASFVDRVQPTTDNWTWGIQGDVTYDLTDDVSLNYVGAYRKFVREEVFTDLTGRLRAPPVPVFVTSSASFNGVYEQNSHEIRLAYNSSQLRLQAGGFYFRETSDIAFIFTGSRGTVGQRGYIFGFPQATTNESIAVFGQGTFDITSSLRVTGGVRWTRDNKKRVGATIFHASLTDPLDFTTGVQPGTTNPSNFSDSLNNAAVKYSKVTWKGGVEFDASTGTLLYANVSTGYKAGGFNDGCLVGTTNCIAAAVVPASLLYYEPEEITAYEAGVKTRLLDNALRLSASIFHYHYTNLQLSQFAELAGAPVNRTLNAGKAKVDGVEFEATARPAPNHQFDFSGTWLNARYTDYLIDPIGPLTVQYAGRKLNRSPEWTASASYTWTIPLGQGGSNLAFNARTRLSDSYVITAPLLVAQFRQPSFTKTDLSVTYNAPDNRFYVQGFVRNLENNLTLANAAPTANLGLVFDDGTVAFADPRLYGVRAGFKF